MHKLKSQAGYSLTEVVIATSILLIISMLTVIVLSSSSEASRLADAQATLQGELRDVMQNISAEVRSAYTTRIVDPLNSEIPAGTVAISVAADKHSVTFQRPQAGLTSAIPLPSTPITIALQCEDASLDNGNAKLDTGEDANADGMLTRRVNRTQSAVSKPLAASNNIANLTFTLMNSQDAGDPIQTTLLVRLVASKLVGAKQRLVKADLESRIHLEN